MITICIALWTRSSLAAFNDDFELLWPFLISDGNR